MIQIIDYGAGNLQSIQNALTRLSAAYQIISKPTEINPDAKLIIAGVGAAGSAMQNLRQTGFASVIPQLKNPLLGICLGMQILFSYSAENDTPCLDVIPGQVQRFPIGLTVPQIGWNQVEFTKPNKLFSDIDLGSKFYFVNSYYCKPVNLDQITATTAYDIDFCSAIQQENFYGVQFHPEKSGIIGEKLLRNFIELC